jgi:hypothetical protein
MIMLLVVTLSLAIYFTLYLSSTYDHKNGILNNKFTKCDLKNYTYSNNHTDDINNVIYYNCNAVFNMYVINNVIYYNCNAVFNMYVINQSYCIIKEQNSTYNNYIIGDTYKIHLTGQMDQTRQQNICNFGSDKKTNTVIYGIGISLFVLFVIIIICYEAYVKLIIQQRNSHNIYVSYAKPVTFIVIQVQPVPNYTQIENGTNSTVHSEYTI